MQGVAMNNIVFLNAARLDFDSQLDFSVLDRIGNLTKYPASREEEILARVQNQAIIITRSYPSAGI